MLLDSAREQINEIDQQMAALFEARMQAVEDVIAYKIENNLQILDASREKTVIEKNLQFIQNERYKEYYEKFITYTMGLSKEYQKELLDKK